MKRNNQSARNIASKSIFLLTLTALSATYAPHIYGQTEARADAGDDDPAVRQADAAPSHEFPHSVRFEQGATRFADGDEITILETRGTTDTFAVGNLYWIKGTYKLASRERAMLAAYVTATDVGQGKCETMKVQSVVIDKGEGTFTLFLPMSYRGCPHVSFYPAEGGEGFGGAYFGTGDSVLKQWWGTK
jgi:hypothetical protein